MSYALNFKIDYFFVFPFGTILYRKVDYFSAYRIDGRSRQEGCEKYTLQQSRRGRFFDSKRKRFLTGQTSGNRTLQKK